MTKNIRGQIETALWILLVLLLPITSLQWLSQIAGGTMVAPASFIPLSLLSILFLVSVFSHRSKLPRQVLPLLGFILAAVFSSGLSFFIDIPLFREINRLSNTLSALVTLAIGIAFYLVASFWPNTTQKLTLLYFWVNVSGFIVIAWSFLQAILWYSGNSYPEWMWNIQNFISSSGNLYNRRVTGLAFEPSWLGHQLVLLYIPYWLAATIRRTSAYSFRVWRLTIENILLGAGAAVLLLAFSRSAILSFALMIGFLLLRFAGYVIQSIQRKIQERRVIQDKALLANSLLPIGLWSGLVVIFCGLLVGLFYGLTRLDPRMAELFSLVKQNLSVTELAYKLIFGERVVFWTAGLEVFSDHPFFGVGLSNAGFFFPEKITPFGWTVVEPIKLYYSSALPNTLSLWVRLLAETGIIGFSIMVSWLLILWKTARYVESHNNPILNTAGLAGQLALIALLMEGMSVDTFAFPYFWLTLGWLTAAEGIARHSAVSR